MQGVIRAKPEGLTQPRAASGDRWMYVVAVLAFFAMFIGGMLWLRSINFFYFKATFPVGEIGAFMICAFVILANVAMRIPMLLRWVQARLLR
jgi:hypothetical protein